jgi:hypothetical protein
LFSIYYTSGLIDVELALISEYFNDPRVSPETMKPVEESFMNDLKKKCNKPIADYESAYNKTQSIQEKSGNLSVGWRTFVFGGSNQSIPASEVLEYSPARARMSVAFNDYVFTQDEAKVFYKMQLGL